MAWTEGQLIRASWYFAAGDFRAATTRTFRVLASQNTGPASGVLALRLANLIGPNMLACMATPATQQGVLIMTATGTPTPIEIAPDLSGSAGTSGNVMLPPQVCGKIRIRGNARIPRNLGSMFIPFPSEDDNTTGGVPTAAYIANLNTLANSLEINIIASDIGPPPTFLPRSVTIRSCMLPSTAPAPNLTGNMAPQLVWSTQRRRSQPPFPNFSPFG